MSKISAIICELNPFHAGHGHIFNAARQESDIVVAVMSGNFVQRGDAAIYDKYVRSKAAIEGGADLVLELPFPYSSSSAEYFARAGVKIAEKVGCTDLYFGSECGDLEALRKCADALNNAVFEGTERAAFGREEYLRNAISDLPESVYSSPNDILGCEYCRYHKLVPHAVKRITTESASSIREKLGNPASDKLFELMFNHFRTIRNLTDNIADSNGGVGGRLYNSAFATNNYNEWMKIAATKQYTNSRLRRVGLYTITGVSNAILKSEPEYTNVLAANKKGRDYLSYIRRKSDIKIFTNTPSKFELSEIGKAQFETADFADKIYTLVSGISDVGYFPKHSPIILE